MGIRYQVKVTANLPYPRSYDYQVNASNLGTALRRGYKLFRKEELTKGKKITEVSVKATKLSNGLA